MNTTAQELGAERWSDYFDSIAPGIEGMHVTIEIMSEQLGDQVEAERLPLSPWEPPMNETCLTLTVES